MSSIPVIAFYESLHLHLHDTHLVYDCFHGIGWDIHCMLIWQMSSRTIFTITRTSCLICILMAYKILCTFWLRSVSDRFQNTFDVLSCCSAPCNSSMSSVFDLRNLDRHWSVTCEAFWWFESFSLEVLQYFYKKISFLCSVPSLNNVFNRPLIAFS